MRTPEITKKTRVPVLPSSSHRSGGRDLWTPPLEEPPHDPETAVWTLLQEVLDPEIPIGIVDLGLIYSVEVTGRKVHLQLTFTATACPCMDFIREDIGDRLLRESWLDEVVIEEVWDPPWSTERITPRARSQLRRLGITV